MFLGSTLSFKEATERCLITVQGRCCTLKKREKKNQTCWPPHRVKKKKSTRNKSQKSKLQLQSLSTHHGFTSQLSTLNQQWTVFFFPLVKKPNLYTLNEFHSTSSYFQLSYFAICFKLVIQIEILVDRHKVWGSSWCSRVTYHRSDQYEGHALEQTPGNGGMWGGPILHKPESSINHTFFSPQIHSITIWPFLLLFTKIKTDFGGGFINSPEIGDNYILSWPGRLLLTINPNINFQKHTGILHSDNIWRLCVWRASWQQTCASGMKYETHIWSDG